MKKKTFLLLTLLSVFCGASAKFYMTNCGEGFYAPSRNFFETFGDWYDYLAEMEEELCGDNMPITIPEDGEVVIFN